MPASAAGPWDPNTKRETLTTPHFQVVYPDGYAAISHRTAEICEALWPYLVKRYRWTPAGRITVVMDDQTDSANGSASVLPNRVITIFLTAPIRTTGLEDYDDWLFTVLVHELAHIFHIDMAYGLTGIGKIFLGQYVAMNGYAAAWSTEGLAVYEETISSGAGRGRSTYVDMIVRVAALADRVPSVDEAYRAFPKWPFGNVTYFFGGRFTLWLGERFGEETLLDYHRGHAANPIPYLTSIPAKIHFGSTIESLWKGFEAELKTQAQFEAQRIEANRPETSPQPLRMTFHGGESVGPRVTPDGQSIIFSARSPADGRRVRRISIDGGSEDILINDTLSQAISFTPDGQAFYFQQTEINNRFYRHNQLLRYDLRKKKIDRVSLEDGYTNFLAPSGALRARDPDVSPDGRAIVFIQNRRSINRLVYAELSEDGLRIRPRVILPGKPDVQLASPRFSPDGKSIALALFEGGRRDIYILDLQSQNLRPITSDRAQDLDPTWSPDGRWLVFSSDRSRVYNLYALNLKTGQQRQLTHLLTGAFQPSISPDGQTLIYRGYSADGFDVYKIPFSPTNAPLALIPHEPPLELDTGVRVFPPKHPDAPEPPPPIRTSSVGDSLTRFDVPEEARPNNWTIGAYNPLVTLVPNGKNWNLLPTLVTSERELRFGLTHFGRDALQTHSYSLTARYGTFSQFLGGTFVYSNDNLHPTFTIFGDADAVTFARTNFVDANRPEGCPFGGFAQTSNGQRVCFGTSGGLYVERRLSVGLTVSLPIRQRQLISFGYTYEDRTALNEEPEAIVRTLLPRQGRFARVRIGYQYSNVRRFPFSISLERGPAFSVSLSAFSRGVGSDFEQFLATADGRYYWDLPWADNHVLATRLSLAAGGGRDVVERFRLGGVSGTSALSVTTQNFFPLRGLAPAVLTGTGQISSALEYRAPLFRVDRGLGTAPIALSVLHAAVFVDAGRTFDTFGDLTRDLNTWSVSAGAEIRANVLLAFVVPLTIRAGLGWPFILSDALDQDLDTQPFFFQLGSAF